MKSFKEFLEESRKKSEIKHFKWRGLDYTFNTRTRMIDGPVSVPYHVAHATPEMIKFLASVFPNEMDD